jgi:hypothetical protein
MATTNNWFLRDDEGTNTWASRQVEEESPYADSTEVSYQVFDYQTIYVDSTQIYYDVDSEVGQIIGGAIFPFASVLSDIQGIYGVSNSSATADLTVSYFSREEIDTQIYSTWNVLIGVEADSEEVVYGLGGYVELESDEIVYSVLEGVEKDTEGLYNLIEGVVSDRIVTYDMTTVPLTATNIVVSTWNIVTALEVDYTSSYYVYTDIEKDVTDTYYVFNEVVKDTALTYNLSGSTFGDKVTTYNVQVFTTVQKDYPFSYMLDSDIVITPNVVGMPLSLASSTLQGAGMLLGTVTYVTLQ